MRARPRKDANHPALVAAFRSLGCSVLDLAQVGNGCPDLLVAYGDAAMLVEVKDGAKVPSARKLTPDQVEFWAGWPGKRCVVKDEHDVQLVAGALVAMQLALWRTRTPAVLATGCDRSEYA